MTARTRHIDDPPLPPNCDAQNAAGTDKPVLAATGLLIERPGLRGRWRAPITPNCIQMYGNRTRDQLKFRMFSPMDSGLTGSLSRLRTSCADRTRPLRNLIDARTMAAIGICNDES
jgi:hypothetical protein